MLLGAHTSIAGGLDQATLMGGRIGAEAIQIFSRSPRMLRNTKPITAEEAEKFRAGMEANGLRAAVIHDNYLINLAAGAAAQLKLARREFAVEMERAQVLGVRFLIFHPGAHGGKGEEKGLKRIAESLDWAVENARAPDVVPCLENTAGMGSALGYKFEQIRWVLDNARHGDRLGMCVDTCHTFAAGYDIRTRQGYENVLMLLDEVVGLGRVKAFHLNDSKNPVNSRVDRHENIGKGKLGKDAFRFLVNDARFQNTPGILETPGGEAEFAKNLKVLKAMRA